MNPDLTPVRHLLRMPKGHSKPQLILFNDGKEYVVKFKNNPTGTRSLVNEYVAGKLAQLLSLPVVPFEIVCVSNNFISDNPELSSRGFQPGQQFASLYIRNCSYLPPEVPDGINLKNRKQLAGVIAFDYWLGNVDRNRKNLLLESLPDSSYLFHIIDHGHCFVHSKWTVDNLNDSPGMSDSWRKAHKLCFSMLKGAEEFTPYIDKIMEVPEQALFRIVQSIPVDWDVSDQEREALTEYLIEAKSRVLYMHDHIKRFFSG